ncbi:hypothetical protein M407DRAFT_157080 [Tulasnella calospora MUT 4182]|uniref:Uncharacterized protein n=1 Tax=Tulasnella calospora MUT 4182 TaxID=1051891 RepID=A0A0C3QR83_9AGAM|nr:hypothetical protein M407DRAFT_157080 [Tulasnella calospora MUT 4182]
MNGAQLAPSSSQLATRNVNKQRRRGSIGYRRSGEDHNPNLSQSSLRRKSLPMTPGLTPNSTVSGRSTSPDTPSDSMSSSRASSEFFQSQAVSSLLSRIASLEEALAISTAATSPSSDARMSFSIVERLASLEEEDDCVAKKVHIPQPGRQPTDDLIDVIADLKAERDDLNNDIVGWRTRCADLTHSTEALQRRLADERRELLLLHQRLSTVTTDLNDSRSAKLKLEDELVSERAAGAAAIRERQQLEEEVNEERMERIGLEMRAEKERLAWQKERNAWETERKGWFKERIQLEEALKRCEETITSLRAELDDRTRQLERLQGTSTDTMPTSKPRQPWTGGKFAFPAASSPPRSESPEQPRPRTSTGFGGLNAGFKFGGSSAPSSGNSTPRPLSSSPPAEGPIPANPLSSVVEEEDDEGQLASYPDDGDSDDDLSDAGLNSSRSSAVNLNSPIPSPTSAVPVPAVHQHRRSVSRVSNWRFPSPRTLEQRRQVAATTALKEKKDRFFACLEDDEDDQSCAAPPRLLGKPLKSKEHKKLPSGCPAFWLDCDEEDQALKREAPLPSPATTEEEDDTETDSIVSKSPVSTTLSFPLIPRTIVTPASASPSRSSSPVDAPVTISVIPPVTVSVVPPANVPTSAPPSRSTVVRSTLPPAPTAPRVATPVFIPATNPTTPLPAVAFSPAPLTTVPPAPRPSMTIPPSINVANNAVSSAPSPPEKAATASSGYFGRLPTLSSMISWGAPRARTPDSEDAFTTYPATSSSATVPSASSSPSKVLKAQHVDPEVMRERLRLQLEREESCGSCNSRNVLEL